MASERECSTSGRPEPSRFSGVAEPGSLVRRVPPKRFVRQQVSSCTLALGNMETSDEGNHTFVVIQVPDEILLNEALNSAIAVLPANYSFEVGWPGQQISAVQSRTLCA